MLSAEAHLFQTARPGTHWLDLGRGGYGRGNLYFAGENPQPGAYINYYLKEKPAGPVAIEITDATGNLKTTFPVKDPQAGINRLIWDMRFDPPASQLKQNIDQMQQMMDRILGRQEVEEAQKKIVDAALEKLKEPGISFREAQAIQREAFEAIGFGQFGRMMRFGRGGGATVAEPGTYAVKLTVNGKTHSSTITVRNDPKLDN